MRFLVSLMLLVTIGLGGCANSPRVGIMAVHESIEILANAGAQAYVYCINVAAGDRATEDECHAEKERRAETLARALPLLQAATGAVITADMVEADTNLQKARALLLGLQSALSRFVATDDQVQVEWLE